MVSFRDRFSVFKNCTGLLLLAILSGCATLHLPDAISRSWANTISVPLATGPVGVVSIVSDTPTVADGKLPGGNTSPKMDAKRGAATGAVVGGTGGVMVAVGACAPFLGGPPLYGMCALAGAALGMLGGGVVGGIAGDISARSRPVRDVNVILADLPSESQLVEGLRMQVLQRARVATALGVVDLGTVPASDATKGFGASPTERGSTLSLQIAVIRGERVDDSHFRFTVLVHTELGSSDGTGPLQKRDYSHKGEPVANIVAHRDGLTAALQTLDATFEEVARKIVDEQLLGSENPPPKAL